MPIVSSAYSKPPRNNGKRLVAKIFHTNHNGDVYECNRFIALDTDLEQFLIDDRTNFEPILIEDEKYAVQKLVEDGVRPEDIVIKHITLEQKEEAVDKALLKLRAERDKVRDIIGNSPDLTGKDIVKGRY